MKKLCIFVLLLLIGAVVCAQQLSPEEILALIDERNSFPEVDFSSEMTIVTDNPGEDRSIFKTRLFRRDDDSKFLLLILEPVLRKGEGYLQVDDTGWAYDPESREFSVFNLSDTFQDSESRNSDFAQTTLLEDYEPTSIEEGKLGKFDVYVLDLKARNDSVAFPRQKFWVRRDNYLLLKVENYSLSDRLVRTVYIPSYAKSGDYFVPTKQLVVDNLNPGEKTEVTFRDFSFSSIPDSVFTRSYLEQVNR